MNNISLTGRITAPPELKQTTSGKSVLSFCVAVNRRFQQNGERKADFIDCVAWNGTAEFISRYFKKGDGIAVQGELQTRNFEDSNGNKRKAVEVLVNQAEFFGSKGQSESAGANEEMETVEDDNLPF